MHIEIVANRDIKDFIKEIIAICDKKVKYRLVIKSRNKYKMPKYTLEVEDTRNEKLIILLIYLNFEVRSIFVLKNDKRYLYPMMKIIK